MRESLYVHLKISPEEFVLVGQCVRDTALNKGVFKYARSYIHRVDAYPFDPINFPLRDEHFYLPYDKENPGIPGFILDGGPDHWGKRLLQTLLNPPPQSEVEFLLAASGTGVGALRFTATKDAPPPDAPFRAFEHLEDMIAIARAIENGEVVDQSQRIYFERGASVGGARPKTLIFYEGAEWIAKFPRIGDEFDNPLVEHLTMQMARETGMNVAETKIVHTSQGNVLLVKRFDWEVDGVIHFISLHSLLNVYAIRDITDEAFNYTQIAKIANGLSSDTQVKHEVFRRMLFNIAVGNTDDHMHNHAMIKKPNEKQYGLAPAYDVVPNPAFIGAHTICVGPMGRMPSKDNVLGAAQQMGLSNGERDHIIQQVKQVTERWQEVMRAENISDNQILRLEKCFVPGQNVLAALVRE
jgi:serine/threonine-protein kinase HipA